MRCHWAHEGGKRFWIPGCMWAVNNPEHDGQCYCRIDEKKLQQKWKENDPEFKARIENKALWKENARLNRIIQKLTSKQDS